MGPDLKILLVRQLHVLRPDTCLHIWMTMHADARADVCMWFVKLKICLGVCQCAWCHPMLTPASNICIGGNRHLTWGHALILVFVLVQLHGVRSFPPSCGIRNFRSRIAYNRWWEGGTLLQQTRGEWFNGFSSLIVPCLETNRNHCSEQQYCDVSLYHTLLWNLDACQKSRPFAIHLRTWQRKWRNSSIFLHLGLLGRWRVWTVWLESEWWTHLPHLCQGPTDEHVVLLCITTSISR